LEPVDNAYSVIRAKLLKEPRKWLITGAAGFIGSNLMEQLLLLNQTVVGLDNFSTGCQANIDEALQGLSPEQAARFRFVEGDICDLPTCQAACNGVNVVLQQAALGSVPRSVADPILTNQNNINGFLNMLVAARDAGVDRFVYASSSSTYGDSPNLPKVEEYIGNPLSPYAITKYVNELYAAVFLRLYGFSSIGLRYFNVFGRRQNPNGAYAAVIPKWFASLLKGETVFINGDGQTSRDFCHIDNVVQANILSACTPDPAAIGQVFNVACGERTTLNELYSLILKLIAASNPGRVWAEPQYRDALPGDVRHSLADIGKATRLLGYNPACLITEGLAQTSDWYQRNQNLA